MKSLKVTIVSVGGQEKSHEERGEGRIGGGGRESPQAFGLRESPTEEILLSFWGFPSTCLDCMAHYHSSPSTFLSQLTTTVQYSTWVVQGERVRVRWSLYPEMCDNRIWCCGSRGCDGSILGPYRVCGFGHEEGEHPTLRYFMVDPKRYTP